MARRIMHIDLDAFFTSVEQVDNPRLKGKPVVVGDQPDRRGVVAAASYEARVFGIHSAMPLKTASRLYPQAIFIEGNIKKYLDAALKFMAILMDFSPFIEPVGIDEAFLDVTGFESLHGSMRQMAGKIRQRIKDDIGINASVGIAGSKLVAKVDMLDSKAAKFERLNSAIDGIGKKYGFTSIQTGRTLRLKDIFPESDRGYTLHTPSLSR